MKIVVNGVEREVISGICLEELLRELDLQAKAGIAVAVNEAVVPAKDWSTHILRAQDSVLIIQATQGG